MPDTELNTDEAILDSMGELDEQTANEETQNESFESSEEIADETPTTSNQQSTDGSTNKEQQISSRGPQDLVDAQGNLIAAGGKERRFYETAQREKQRSESLTKELDNAKMQLDAISTAGNLGTQYSLSPEELTTGAQIISAYKENPVETLQYMLTQAQAAGHNISEIGMGGSVDTQAIKQMIDNAVKPLVSEQQYKQETEQTNQEAEQEYNSFVSKYPDAPVHEQALTRLLQDDSTLSPEAAYLKLQNFYLQKGLDWNKPLDQLQQEHDAQKATGPMPNTQQQLPNGNVNASNATDTSSVANHNTSTSDIIRDAMREAGLQI